jgi:hypothetical protein
MRIKTDVMIEGEGKHPSPLWVTWQELDSL